MIRVLFAASDSEIPDERREYYLRKIPGSIRDRISRYVRWQDRQAGLFGKLLLLKGLTEYGYPPDCLNSLSYNDFGRPFLDSGIDFNISHSGAYAVCAFTDREIVGIDIEKIRPVALSDFKTYMTDQEWENIAASDRQYDRFYEHWTMKESVIKAEGRGLSVPLRDIRLDQGKAVLYDTVWFLKELRLDVRYKCCLALNSEPPEFEIRQVRF